MKKALPPQIKKFPAAKQQRMDKLLDKNSEETITARERAELKKLVADAERLMIANGKQLARFAETHPGASPGAVPLTVWVTPQPSGA